VAFWQMVNGKGIFLERCSAHAMKCGISITQFRNNPLTKTDANFGRGLYSPLEKLSEDMIKCIFNEVNASAAGQHIYAYCGCGWLR